MTTAEVRPNDLQSVDLGKPTPAATSVIGGSDKAEQAASQALPKSPVVPPESKTPKAKKCQFCGNWTRLLLIAAAHLIVTVNVLAIGIITGTAPVLIGGIFGALSFAYLTFSWKDITKNSNKAAWKNATVNTLGQGTIAFLAQTMSVMPLKSAPVLLIATLFIATLAKYVHEEHKYIMSKKVCVAA